MRPSDKSLCIIKVTIFVLALLAASPTRPSAQAINGLFEGVWRCGSPHSELTIVSHQRPFDPPHAAAGGVGDDDKEHKEKGVQPRPAETDSGYGDEKMVRRDFADDIGVALTQHDGTLSPGFSSACSGIQISSSPS